jgi:hypothetical protein
MHHRQAKAVMQNGRRADRIWLLATEQVAHFDARLDPLFVAQQPQAQPRGVDLRELRDDLGLETRVRRRETGCSTDRLEDAGVGQASALVDEQPDRGALDLDRRLLSVVAGRRHHGTPGRIDVAARLRHRVGDLQGRIAGDPSEPSGQDVSTATAKLQNQALDLAPLGDLVDERLRQDACHGDQSRLHR